MLKCRNHKVLTRDWILKVGRPNTKFVYDAPPSFLMDSIASPKVKTMEGEGVKAHSLVRSTFDAVPTPSTQGD